MKNFIILSTSAALVAALALNGCGGSSSTEDISISGKAIDPELQGAKVCLDLNTNRVCDVNEPYTLTNNVGEYTLTIAQEQHATAHALLATNGIDIGTNKDFKGTLTAVKEAHETVHNITPLTTMIEARYQHCQLHQQECQETEKEIETTLAAHVDLQEDDMTANIVTLANNGQEEALKVALSFQKSAEIFNPHDPLEFYRLMAAQGFETGKTWRENIGVVVATSPNAAKIEALVTMIMGLSVGDAHALAHQVAEEVVRLNPIIPPNPIIP